MEMDDSDLECVMASVFMRCVGVTNAPCTAPPVTPAISDAIGCVPSILFTSPSTNKIGRPLVTACNAPNGKNLFNSKWRQEKHLTRGRALHRGLAA